MLPTIITAASSFSIKIYHASMASYLFTKTLKSSVFRLFSRASSLYKTKTPLHFLNPIASFPPLFSLPQQEFSLSQSCYQLLIPEKIVSRSSRLNVCHLLLTAGCNFAILQYLCSYFPVEPSLCPHFSLLFMYRPFAFLFPQNKQPK